MNKLNAVLIGIGMLFSALATSQDFYFSQFNASPLNLNPALTGAINGKARIIANHRNQWTQVLGVDSYKTYSVSYDHRINLDSVNYVGLGLVAVSDVSGELQLGTKAAHLSVSFARLIARTGSTSHSLKGGMQFGIARRVLDLTNARWSSKAEPVEEEYIDDLLGFSPDYLYPDLNLGMVWVSRFGLRKSLYLGLAVSHVNKPNMSFFNNQNKEPLSMRTSLSAGGELPLWRQLSLVPSMMYLSQGVHSQLDIGTSLRFGSGSHDFLSYVEAGIYSRFGKSIESAFQSDAIIMVLSVQLRRVHLGISLDHLLSDLRGADTATRAFEFSAGYLFGRMDRDVSPFDIPRI